MSDVDPKVLLNQAPSVCKSLFGVRLKIISSPQSDKAYQNLLCFMNLACQKKDWLLKNSTDMSSNWMNSL